jgi:2'-5' RNA ligase
MRLQDILPIVQMLEGQLAEFASFELNLGPIQWFPASHDRKILTLSLLSQEYLQALSELIAEVLQRFNYPIEARAFKAHLTVGRVKYYQTNLEQFSEIRTPSFPSVSVVRVHLV